MMKANFVLIPLSEYEEFKNQIEQTNCANVKGLADKIALTGKMQMLYDAKYCRIFLDDYTVHKINKMNPELLKLTIL